MELKLKEMDRKEQKMGEKTKMMRTITNFGPSGHYSPTDSIEEACRLEQHYQTPATPRVKEVLKHSDFRMNEQERNKYSPKYESSYSNRLDYSKINQNSFGSKINQSESSGSDQSESSAADDLEAAGKAVNPECPGIVAGESPFTEHFLR